jgi:hypothetical protein
VSGLMRTTNELGEESVILDDTDGVFGEKQPEICLFGTAAAVTANGCLDLVCFNFEDVASTMAVTSIRFDILGR